MKRITLTDFLIISVGLLFILLILSPSFAAYEQGENAKAKDLILQNIRSDGVSRIEIKDWAPFEADSRTMDSKRLSKRIRNLKLDSIETVKIEKSKNLVEVVVHFKNRQ